MDGLFSIKEAAQYLASSDAMLRTWVHQRKLPVVEIGRLTRIRLDDLQAWVRLGLGKKEQEISS
jgi:excisionase family DNA binding protein